MQFTSVHAWARGDVVLCGDARWLVWRSEQGKVLAFQVRYRKAPQHRSDVPLDDIPTMAAMGLPGGFYVIRAVDVRRIRPSGRIGSAPSDVISRVAVAVAREAATREFENTRGGTYTETCVRF